MKIKKDMKSKQKNEWNRMEWGVMDRQTETEKETDREKTSRGERN